MRHHTEVSKLKISKGNMREKNGNWNGGIRILSTGYTQFKVPEGCRFSIMKDKKGYIQLHRLIMAAHLGRPLKPGEVVHHINGDITDNRIDNLKLFKNNGEHLSEHKIYKNKKEWTKQWRKKNKLRLNKLSREYYYNNREKILEQKKEYWLSKYKGGANGKI